MAEKITISLDDHFAEYARRKVESGEFGSTSEVVREAMRQFKHEQDGVDALRGIIRKSLNSGPARPFDWDAFMERKFSPEGDA